MITSRKKTRKRITTGMKWKRPRDGKTSKRCLDTQHIGDLVLVKFSLEYASRKESIKEQ